MRTQQITRETGRQGKTGDGSGKDSERQGTVLCLALVV